MTKGILNIEDTAKTRIALVGILLRNSQVFSYEWPFVDRMARLFHRNFTVAEANRIHQMRGRMGSDN